MKTFLVASVAGGIALSANAQVLLDDDFSYGDIAAFHDVWVPDGAGEANAATLTPEGVSIVRQATPNFHSWSGSFNYTPTDTEQLVFTAKMYDDGVGALTNNAAGLRTGANPLFEMGYYAGDDAMYSVRFHSMHGSTPGWTYFADESLGGTKDLAREEGWHTFTATIGSTSTVVTLDLGSNGTIDAQLTLSGSAIGAFSEARIGGAGGAASNNVATTYESVSLEIIPEPSTYAAIFGGLALVGAFVYRRRVSAKK